VRGEVSTEFPTSELHYLYFFSDILVVSHVLSCVPSACCSVSAFAPEPLEQIVHRASAAFLYRTKGVGSRVAIPVCAFCDHSAVTGRFAWIWWAGARQLETWAPPPAL